MGFREADLPLGLGKGVSQDCMICHGGSIAGQSYVGLGNSTPRLPDLLGRPEPGDGPLRQDAVHVRQRPRHHRGRRLRRLPARLPRAGPVAAPQAARPRTCTTTCARTRRPGGCSRKRRPCTTTAAAISARFALLMQFMMSPLNFPSAFKTAEPDFKDIREFLLSIQPPKYPLPIDAELAERGQVLFEANCARCHGTYGENWTYPNKIIPIDKIGTDRKRFDGLSQAVRRVLQQELVRRGVQGAAVRSATRRRRSTASGPPPPTSTTAPCRRSTTS